MARGSVFRLEVGYPVFMTEGTTLVHGHLVQLKPSETLPKVLDELHGYSAAQPENSLYLKTLVQVFRVGETDPVGAWTYSMNPAKLPRNAVLIKDGDWKKSMEEKQPLTQNLTTSQRNYIQRLGKSTGRDIVPINLDLYRELMNKGLIVDKGRRLALTQLGQEVFRFLD
jgi:gamma-glutamylcyclotransferase (GGCT)/AIG2-like uncharacterized protein YtfP